MRLEFLGPVRVQADQLIAVERPAQRRLLSILALAAGRRLSTDVLIDRFWPNQPPNTARAAIQTHVSGLRKVLGDGVVATEVYGYRLDLDSNELDVVEFDRRSLEARDFASAHDWDGALEAAESGLTLWRDDPFPELADDEFARPEISRLTELHLELQERRAETLLALNRSEEALPDLESLVVEHPYRERLWEHLMTARYRLGRHSEALQAFKQVSEHLAEIGVEPGRPLQRLEERILLHDQTLTSTRHNLPAELDSFIGRETEVEEIIAMLANNRLVNLTGPGGSGKTRLAIHTAHQLLAHHPDGIFYVELADIDDPLQILPQIAISIGLSSGESDLQKIVETALATSEALIVLDNCEHLVEGTSSVLAPLLGAAPNLTVLTTSRQPLRMAGENLFHVPGLALPTDADGPAAAASDAVRLFGHRARQVDVGFDVDANLEAIVKICRRLDAMPLGIELAAARVSSIGIDALGQHLESSFRLLTTGDTGGHPRHQTLRAATEWSYRLASDEEQRALATLSAFRGGFDLEMATWIVGEAAPTLVAGLVDQSLVVAYQGRRGRRYRLLETIRQFGLDKAHELDIADAVLAKHSDWCVAFTQQIWDAWQKPAMDQMSISFHEESENLTSAFDRAERSGDRALAGRIAEGLLWHWQGMGYLRRSLEFYGRALETCRDDDRRVGLLAKRVGPRFKLNDLEGAFEDAEEAFRGAGPLPPSTAKAYAVSGYGHMFGIRPDLDASEGIPYLEEALAIAAETNNELLIAVLQLDLALAYGWAGNQEKARPLLKEAVARIEATGDPVTVAYTYNQATTTGMQFADMRREALNDYPNRLARWLDEHKEIASEFRLGWLEWAAISRGELVEIEAELKSWEDERHLEGFQKLENLVPRGVAIWMQGRLDDALRVVDECDAIGVNPRWYHDFYPLKVDVLVDMGRWAAAKSAAEDYLNFDSDPAESAKKLGVLNPLVRAVADRGQSDTVESDLVAEGEALIERMEEILTEHPPPMDGSVAMETHTTHLMFARAELTRLTGPDPKAWHAAMSAADYIYFRLYAQIRLGEALRATGDEAGGQRELRDALAESTEIGALGLVRLAEDLLSD